MTEEEFKQRINHLAPYYGNIDSDEYGRHVQNLLEECLNIIIVDETGDHRLPWMPYYRNRYFVKKYTIESYIHSCVRDAIDRIHSL